MILHNIGKKIGRLLKASQMDSSFCTSKEPLKILPGNGVYCTTSAFTRGCSGRKLAWCPLPPQLSQDRRSPPTHLCCVVHSSCCEFPRPWTLQGNKSGETGSIPKSVGKKPTTQPHSSPHNLRTLPPGSGNFFCSYHISSHFLSQSPSFSPGESA